MSVRAQRVTESRELAQLLVYAAEQAKADFAATVADFGLPVHLARAILMLDAAAPMHQLAEHLACDRSYVTGLADGLEERGLVERLPGADRRIKLLALTEAGEALRTQISEAVAERSLVMGRLDDSERAQLASLLAALLGEERRA